MNIFILHRVPRLAARYHCDKHVIKMITESCQMMSTCLIEKYNLQSDVLYKVTHKNHPCNIWLRNSNGNLLWLTKLTKGLIDEYELRYKKKDKYIRAKKIIAFIDSLDLLNNEPMTDFALAMPDEYKVASDPIKSYRNYYKLDKKDKSDIVQYKYSKIPNWLI